MAPVQSTDSTENNAIELDQTAQKQSAGLKAAGNEFFRAGNYLAAAEQYTQAIALDPLNPILYTNRANARQKLEETGLAIADATKAIELDPNALKAFYRRALCQLAILDFPAAVKDFRRVLVVDSKNALARAQLDSTLKMIKRIAFEKAIAVESGPTVVDRILQQITDGAVEIEAGYLGPVLPEAPPSDQQLSPSKFTIDEDFIQKMIAWFKDGKFLHRRVAWEIILAADRVMKKEESLVTLPVEKDCTVDVIGDVHGQLYDVLHLLELTGPPSDKHALLFNGDFVDRGSWSTEVIFLLFAYKWLYPSRVFLNRGNHETLDMNKVYGFEGECKHKYTELTYKLFSDVFTSLPLATLVSPVLPPAVSTKADIVTAGGLKRYFVVHGGLFSKDEVTLEDIRKEPRFGRQPATGNLMHEMLWTDPQPMQGRGPSKRGVGISFGPDVTERWCRLNSVTGIFRSHEVRQGGYAIEHDGRCTTVFSAPNYCDAQGNKGAFIRVSDDGALKYTTFDAKPHPNIKPMAYNGAFGQGMS